MEITFTLRFTFDDPYEERRRRFAKDEMMQVPYSPRIGECVVIPGVGSTNLAAHRIADLIYTPTGAVILDFKIDGLVVNPAQQAQVLIQAGFQEVQDAVQSNE